MRTRIAITAAVMLGGAAIHAQQPQKTQEIPGPQDPPAETLMLSAERLARELTPMNRDGTADTPLVFRSGVTAKVFTLPSPWQITEPLPVHRGAGLYHQEFIDLVTPEAFRGSSRYVASASVDPGEMFQSVKRAWHDWQERRIHKQVEDEVAELQRIVERNRASAAQDPP